jgi:transcriptional regulator with XRE-family HTH domain
MALVDREPREIFAENLKTCRLRAGLSQEALGTAAGLHRTEVSLLERGGRDPRLSTVVRMARALGVPSSRLLRGL